VEKNKELSGWGNRIWKTSITSSAVSLWRCILIKAKVVFLGKGIRPLVDGCHHTGRRIEIREISREIFEISIPDIERSTFCAPQAYDYWSRRE
jgi:hypothetical protein